MNGAPEIGDKLRFKPAAWMENPDRYSITPEGREVTGVVIQINKEHRWIRVSYACGGQTSFECFKF